MSQIGPGINVSFLIQMGQIEIIYLLQIHYANSTLDQGQQSDIYRGLTLFRTNFTA